MNDESPNRSRSIDLNLTKMLERAKNNSFQLQKVSVGDLINKSSNNIIVKPVRQSLTPTPDEKENKELTFKPQINKYPGYLKQTSFLERNEQWQKNKILKQNENSKAYLEEQEKIISKECSFKPRIIPHQASKIPRQQKTQPSNNTQIVKNYQPTAAISIQAIQYELRKQLYGFQI